MRMTDKKWAFEDFEEGASIPLGELARNLYSMNHQAGRGKLDFSSVVQLVTPEK